MILGRIICITNVKAKKSLLIAYLGPDLPGVPEWEKNRSTAIFCHFIFHPRLLPHPIIFYPYE